MFKITILLPGQWLLFNLISLTCGVYVCIHVYSCYNWTKNMILSDLFFGCTAWVAETAVILMLIQTSQWAPLHFWCATNWKHEVEVRIGATFIKVHHCAVACVSWVMVSSSPHPVTKSFTSAIYLTKHATSRQTSRAAIGQIWCKILLDLASSPHRTSRPDMH